MSTSPCRHRLNYQHREDHASQLTERWLEVIPAIMLGGRVATAWSGYQGARWGGVQMSKSRPPPSAESIALKHWPGKIACMTSVCSTNG
jgi:hypothetical protein